MKAPMELLYLAVIQTIVITRQEIFTPEEDG
jgi:hypothetical protein